MSRFRRESWWSTIVREMSLICIRIRTLLPFDCHLNGCLPGLALKLRHAGTRKWAIMTPEKGPKSFGSFEKRVQFILVTMTTIVEKRFFQNGGGTNECDGFGKF